MGQGDILAHGEAVKITQKQVRAHLLYNPRTGAITRRIANSNSVKRGDFAGQRHDGYLRIQVLGVRKLAQYWIWLYMTGREPLDEIDHRDGDRSNYRWSNLREASHSLNQQNLRKARSTSTTGFLGVCRMGRKFQAAITVSKKKQFLGTFSTARLAHAAYLKAKRELHEGCTI